jgi:hypothetical protein
MYVRIKEQKSISLSSMYVVKGSIFHVNSKWNVCMKLFTYIHTYIPLMLYPRRGSRGADIAPKPTFYKKLLGCEEYCIRDRW